MNTATVTLRFEDADAAHRAAESLGPDNDGFITCSTDGNTLILEATSDSIMGILRTLDDALGCLRATGMD